jgi:glycosyltransferase involved in cell wall biosynthesis
VSASGASAATLAAAFFYGVPIAGSDDLDVFIAFRDSPERRGALAQPPGSAERYRLFGLDELVRRGATVRHNLERPGPPPVWARLADRAVNAVLYRSGGYGGDFASILAALRRVNAADVVLSTVDTVGLPLVLLARAGLVRTPIVYVAIGLPERLERLRGPRIRRLYRTAFARARAIVAYAESEADWLRDWLGPGAPPVTFMPFGVDAEAFSPERKRRDWIDVVSVGADPRRDFALLAQVAERRQDLTFHVVAGPEHERTLRRVPENVTVETDVPLERVRECLAEARVVALPVRDNSYSGATTVLLQAMAMGKPVVVSRTRAIATGYGLEDRLNCRLVEPGSADELEAAIVELLADAGAAASLGTHARETVERGLSWERYTGALWELLARA